MRFEVFQAFFLEYASVSNKPETHNLCLLVLVICVETIGVHFGGSLCFQSTVGSGKKLTNASHPMQTFENHRSYMNKFS